MRGIFVEEVHTMVVDEDVLEKEDMYILDRMKQFVTTEPVKGFGAARVLLAQIERAVSAFACLLQRPKLTIYVSSVVATTT